MSNTRHAPTMQEPVQDNPTERAPQAPAASKTQGDKLENAVSGVAHGIIDEPISEARADDLPAPLQKAAEEIAELKDAWLRAKAEVENTRRQGALDVAKAHKFAIERFAEDLLPVADSLQQALSVENATPEQLRSGVELTLKQLQAAFGRAQLVEIDPAGAKFDPHQHQAMQMVDADQAPNTVVQVFQKGYALNDRVLRPALVTVAKG